MKKTTYTRGSKEIDIVEPVKDRISPRVNKYIIFINMKTKSNKTKLSFKQRELAYQKKLKDVKGKPFFKLSKSPDRLFDVVLPRTIE